VAEEGPVAVGLDAAEGVAVFVLVPPQAPSRRTAKAAVTKRAPAVYETLTIENLQFVVLPLVKVFPLTRAGQR
jgi:hypothetical protein